MVNKKLINGLKYEKLSEEQLYDLSQWELVDIILAYRKDLKRKEQECERLKIYIESNEQQVKEVETLVMDNDRLINELDQLKAEVKSKTEYIQEQMEIINHYSKEIEMYKKCQGKRASKREEELKAENEELKTGLKQIQKQFGIEILYCKTTGESTFRSTEILKLKQTLTEIKPILEFYANSKIGEEQPDGTYKYSGKYFESDDSVYINYDPKPAREGLKKISEVVG